MDERNIVFEVIKRQPVEDMNVEIVERKGLGHPDYIADSASEAASRELSKYYLEEFGVILHHNLDKTLLVGGQSHPRFGGGYVVEPINIIVAGRATTEVKTDDGVVNIPFGTIIVRAVKEWIRENMRYLDPEVHVSVDYKVRKGSIDLVSLFEASRERKVPLANDTSIGVGYAPLSTLERIVLETERMLNSKEYKSKNPAVGEDIKVLGLRKGSRIDLTIASAVVDRHVRDVDEYLNVKEQVENDVLDLTSKITSSHDVKVYVNTADMPHRGIVYLTVTGTSAEHGDDGATGRGNRANGLIPPMRPISMEATAGKNPVSHVGKIYNVVAHRIANRIYEELGGSLREVYVEIVSQIGKPIDQPMMAAIRAVANDKSSLTANIINEAKSIANEELANITRVTSLVVERKVALY